MGRNNSVSSGYDKPERLHHELGLIDFGAGADVTKLIRVPAAKFGGTGMRGRVRGVLISQVSEDFAGSTLDAGVQVGDGSDADKYFDSGRVLDETVDVADGETIFLNNDDSEGGAGEDAEDIEAGRSTVTVTCQVATGSPTGQAHVTVVIDWYT
jgi:hypothetical protein